MAVASIFLAFTIYSFHPPSMGVLGGSVAEVGARLRQGVVTAVEVCEAALQRQAAVAALRPFITPTQDTARHAAAQAHQR